MTVAERELIQVDHKNGSIQVVDAPEVQIPQQGFCFIKTASGYEAIPLTETEIDRATRQVEDNAHKLTNRLHAFLKIKVTSSTLEGESITFSLVPNALYQGD